MAMKKLVIYSLSVLLGIALVSCAKEQRVEDVNATDSTVYKVVLSNGPATSASFTDMDGLQWQEGDVLRWEGNTGNTSHTLTAGEISGDGYTATFEIAIPNIKNESPRGVFRYNYNSANNAEWNFGSPERIVIDPSISFTNGNNVTYTQSVAGEMNRAFVFLHSSTTWETFAQAATETPEITASMDLLGSIFRILPYTTDYNDESITSVTFALKNSSKRLGGLVFYNYGGAEYLDANQKDYNSYHTAKVNLGTPFSLSGVTDKASSKGIYFAVPATNSAISGGYTIVIRTNKATYTYSSDKDLNVSENKVRNFPILLDSAHRLGDDAVYGTYWFEGSLGSSYEYASAEVNVADLAYWYARSRDDGSGTENNREPADYPDFYTGIISAVDDATGLAPDWLTFNYASSTSTHLSVHLDANAGAARSATVTMTYHPFAHHYNLTGSATKVITISQAAYVTTTHTISTSEALSLDNGKHFGLIVNLDYELGGTPASLSEFNSYFSLSTLSATNARIRRSDKVVTVDVLPNPTASPRDIVISFTYDAVEKHVTFTQAAGASDYNPPYKYVIGDWTKTAGDPTISITADGTSSTPSGAWLCAFNNLQKWDGSAWVNVTDKAQIDFDVLCEQMFGKTAEGDWFHLDWNSFGAYPGESIIKVATGTVADANTGAARSFTGYVMEYDHSKHHRVYTMNQAVVVSAGDNYWPTLDVSTSNSYYGPGWAAQAFPTIVKGASNSSYSFTIPDACNARWQCQLKMVTDLPALDAGKTYDFSATINCSNTNSVRIQLMTAGIGYPVDDDFDVSTANSDMVFDKQFTGYALVNATLIFDFGYAPAGTDVIIKNIVLKEHID